MQSQCKPNAERGKLACMSYAEVKPDFEKQSKNTSIELYKIILNTYLSYVDILFNSSDKKWILYFLFAWKLYHVFLYKDIRV